MNPYLDLYLTCARIGVCTFGGGYAMLPILQREVVENRHWATEDELMDYYLDSVSAAQANTTPVIMPKKAPAVPDNFEDFNIRDYV